MTYDHCRPLTVNLFPQATVSPNLIPPPTTFQGLPDPWADYQGDHTLDDLPVVPARAKCRSRKSVWTSGRDICPINNEPWGLPRGMWLDDGKLCFVPAPAEPQVRILVERWAFREHRLRTRGVIHPGEFDPLNAHRLGRELKRLGFDPSTDFARVGELASAAGTLSVAVGEAVRAAWLDANSPDTFDVAAAAVDAEFAASPLTGRARRRAQVAALARVFSTFADTPRHYFAFGSARIAEWLMVHRNTIDEDIRALEADGVIRVRRDESGRVVWSYRAGDAREVQYVPPVNDSSTPHLGGVLIPETDAQEGERLDFQARGPVHGRCRGERSDAAGRGDEVVQGCYDGHPLLPSQTG